MLPAFSILDPSSQDPDPLLISSFWVFKGFKQLVNLNKKACLCQIQYKAYYTLNNLCILFVPHNNASNSCIDRYMVCYPIRIQGGV